LAISEIRSNKDLDGAEFRETRWFSAKDPGFRFAPPGLLLVMPASRRASTSSFLEGKKDVDGCDI
jgi:hypothetical protein